jgi:hypothetical protein
MLFRWGFIDENIISMGTSSAQGFLLWRVAIAQFSGLQPSITSIHMHQMDNTQS